MRAETNHDVEQTEMAIDVQSDIMRGRHGRFPLRQITYRIDEVKQIAGKPYRLGFLLADMRELRPVDRVLHKRRHIDFALGRLFHYTSLPGLQGIVKDAGFWASDNRFMNDTEEFGHGVDVVQKALGHAVRRPKAPLFHDVLLAVRRRLEERPAEGNLIVCFSSAEDSLEQWRGYGPSGGVCLEFDGSQKRTEGFRPAFYGPDMLPQKVAYDDRTKLTIALQTIRVFEDEYFRDRMAMENNWPDDHDQHYTSRLATWLLYQASLFKDEAFKREQEARVAIPYDNADRFGGLQFRPSALGLVPFVNTGCNGAVGKLPIRRIVVGPSPHQSTVLQSVRTFLDHNGYTETRVQASRVPFRSY